MTEEFRKTAPEPLEAISFNVPKPFETKLSNGLKIYIVEDKRHPLINFQLAFPKGDVNDPSDGIGITSTMGAMINEGTENYSSRELAEKIENLGASLGVSVGQDNTIVNANTLAMYRAEIIELIAELVLRPTFPEDELELYKQNALEGLKYQRSQPDFLADEHVGKIVYGSHPYGVNSPMEDDIEKLTRDQLVNQHKKIFIPDNAMLIVVGDVDSESLVKEFANVFSEWQGGEVDAPEFPSFPERSGRSITIVDRPGSSQSNIVLTNIGIDRKNADYFPVLVMNQILGAGASSRLFMNLREEKGYTYGAYSRTYTKRLGGSFEATSEVRTSVTGDSMKEFFYELERIRNEKVSQDELDDAKNYLTGVFPLKAETQGGLTGLIVSQVLYDLPEDYLETYRDEVNKITLEDVERVANKYVTPDKIAIVIVGDAEEVLPQIKSYSENIEIFDAEGNPRDLKKYVQDKNAETADAAGNWTLTVEAMGQELEVNLSIEQDGENVSGKIESAFGSGEISDGKVAGNKLTATATTDLQGQSVELGIKGTVDGDSLEGTINAPMIPMPLEFKGNRN